MESMRCREAAAHICYVYIDIYIYIHIHIYVYVYIYIYIYINRYCINMQTYINQLYESYLCICALCFVLCREKCLPKTLGGKAWDVWKHGKTNLPRGS